MISSWSSKLINKETIIIMAMIKRAKTGQIKELVDEQEQVVPQIQWSDDIRIKDVLEVPTTRSNDIDVDLDEEDEGEIAVKV